MGKAQPGTISVDTAVNTQAYQETGAVLKPYANLGKSSRSQGFPDGTSASRCQVGLRFVS